MITSKCLSRTRFIKDIFEYIYIFKFNVKRIMCDTHIRISLSFVGEYIIFPHLTVKAKYIDRMI